MKGKPSSKIAAAMAAVFQYLEEEQAATAAPAVPAPAPAYSPWGAAGRQDAMLFRTLWQRRLSRSW